MLLFMYISHQARVPDRFVNLSENNFWYFTTESRFELTNLFFFMIPDSGFYFKKDLAISGLTFFLKFVFNIGDLREIMFMNVLFTSKIKVIILWGVMAILGFRLDYIGTELQSTNGGKPVRYFFLLGLK